MRWILTLCAALTCVALSLAKAEASRQVATTAPTTRTTVQILEALPKDLHPSRRRPWGEEEARRANNWALEHMPTTGLRVRGKINAIQVTDVGTGLNPPQRISVAIENEFSFGGHTWMETAQFTTDLAFDEGVKWRDVKAGAWVEIVASNANFALGEPQHSGSKHRISLGMYGLEPAPSVTLRALRGPRER